MSTLTVPDTSPRKGPPRWFIAACAGVFGVGAVIVLATPDPAPEDTTQQRDYAARVESTVMSAYGADTPQQLCQDGIGWACDIRATTATPGGNVDLETRLTQGDRDSAEGLARTYILTGPDDLSSVAVYDSQGVAIDYWLASEFPR